MFRVNQLFNLNDDVQFFKMFQNLDAKDFEFFAPKQVYVSWVINLNLLSSEGLKQMEEHIKQNPDPMMSRRFYEMQKLFQTHHLKNIRQEITRVYKTWFSRFENTNTVSLRYLALKYNLTDALERVFEHQENKSSLYFKVQDIDEITIVAGNPHFYFCKKFTDAQNFETSSVRPLHDYNLKIFLDTPILGLDYCSKFNPAYGLYMNKGFSSYSFGKQMMYVLLKPYNLENLLETPQPSKAESSSTTTTNSDSEDSD